MAIKMTKRTKWIIGISAALVAGTTAYLVFFRPKTGAASAQKKDNSTNNNTGKGNSSVSNTGTSYPVLAISNHTDVNVRTGSSTTAQILHMAQADDVLGIRVGSENGFAKILPIPAGMPIGNTLDSTASKNILSASPIYVYEDYVKEIGKINLT